jgi:hypothetical protein
MGTTHPLLDQLPSVLPVGHSPGEAPSLISDLDRRLLTRAELREPPEVECRGVIGARRVAEVVGPDLTCDMSEGWDEPALLCTTATQS